MNDPASLRESFASAESLLKAGQPEQAVKALRAILDTHPREVNARRLLGVLRLAQGNTGDAVRHLKAAVAQALGFTQAALDLARTLRQGGDQVAGQDALRRSAALDPFRKQIAAALEHLRKGQRKAAEDIFRKILRTRSDHVPALVGLASIALDAGAVKDAERLLRHALSIAPNMDSVWRGLARVHSERSDYPQAESAAERALALFPDNPDSLTMLGTVQA